MKREKLTIRDLLAVPFWSLALVCDWAAIYIGGRWTARMFFEQALKLRDYLSNEKN